MAAPVQILVAPPKDTPFTDAAGRITLPWLAWLGTLTGALLAVNNLSEVAAAPARTSLGLGTAATADASAFDAAGSAAGAAATALQKASNLSDLASAASARLNLGLGSAAATDSTAYDAAGAWASWVGDVAANAHNLSNAGIVNTAGLQVTAFLAFAGSMYYQPGASTYFTSANAGAGAWNEFAFFVQPGASLGLDAWWLSVNSRSVLGGADSYAPAMSVKALTGAVTFPSGVTVAGLASGAAITGTLGGWIGYTPTVTPLSPMTLTSAVTVNDAQYIQVGPVVHLKMQLAFTLGGTASALIKISYPPLAPPVGYASLLTAAFAMAGGPAYVVGVSTVYLPNGYIGVQLQGAAAFTLGAVSLYLTGTYRAG